uniref:Mediator complex subunit 15 KIX domain-containing protein n=1 Tax=Aegilops tauschii TaxID=37682 RepID=M8AV28_AEGTA
MELVFDGGGAGGANNWRSQIREEVRVSRVSVLSEALMQALSPDKPETLTDLLNVAVRLESLIFGVAVSEVDYKYKLYTRLDHLEGISSDNHLEDISSDDHFEDISSDDHFEEISSDYQMLEPSTATLLRGIFSDPQSQSIQVQSNLHRVLSGGNTKATAPIGNEEKPCCDDNDRISVLHESILHCIMSFMPAQDVVRTSMLFRRSPPLWTSAPCLDIDIDHFDMDRVKFNKFAKSLFEGRGNANTLDKLRLHSFAIDAAKYWIGDAIRLHKVKSIDFTENTRWEAFYLDPEAISFSSKYLQTVKLTNVIIVTSVFDQLSRECESLENLQLADSTLCSPEISSSSLKTLEIINCLVLNHLLIRTGKLVSLCFKDTRCGCTPKYIVRTTSAVILCDLSNAKSIELPTPVAFDRMTPGCPMFISLTSLILGEWCLSNKFAPLACFLKHSPMLENLDLKLKFDCEAQKQPLQMAEGILFQAKSLKKVTIHCAEEEDRLPVLKAILLANARCVKHIDVKTY